MLFQNTERERTISAVSSQDVITDVLGRLVTIRQHPPF